MRTSTHCHGCCLADFASDPKVELLRKERILGTQREFHGNFVRAKAIQFPIVFHRKAIIEKKSMVALLSVRVIYLSTGGYGLEANDKQKKS